MSQLLHTFDVFGPLHDLWWLAVGHPLSWGLASLYYLFAGVPTLEVLGAYGLAIIALTLLIKLLLAPLYQLQLRISRRAADDQRRVAPHIERIKSLHPGDPRRQQEEMLKLYREHGVNPLNGLAAIVPGLLQGMILIAMYWVFLGNAQSNTFPDHFLFVPHLNHAPMAHALVAGLPIPAPAYLVIPILAAATTWILSKVAQQPPPAAVTDQGRMQAQMQQSMQVMLPLMIGYFALVVPAGLGLYWLVSNCITIAQHILSGTWPT